MGGFATDTTVTTIKLVIPNVEVEVLVTASNDGVNGTDYSAVYLWPGSAESHPVDVEVVTETLVDGVDSDLPECDECGQTFHVDDAGVANHVHDGEIDHDADADHVPFAVED